MTEDDFAYLRNINTRPGPNAGRSIDPTKPGPDADRIAELEREIARAGGIKFEPDRHRRVGEIAAELARLRNEQPQGGDGPYFITGGDGQTYEARYDLPLPSESPAPSPGPQDVREALEEAAKAAAYLIDRLQACLAGKPVRDLDEAIEAYANRTNEAALAQSAKPESQDVRALLREARQYVVDAGSDEELTTSELQLHKIGLLEDIDAALAQSDAQPSIEPVTFWYQNYRGEISRRVAAVLGIRWGTSEYHKEPQWLLRAFDLEKEAEREFAVKDMAPTRDALNQSDAQPVGWQLVPIEPTPEMGSAAQNALNIYIQSLPKKEQQLARNGALARGLKDRVRYQAMVRAAPEPPAMLVATAPPDASGLVDAAVLERYAQSIAMWCERENVTDQERLSYIKGHPVTRAAARAHPRRWRLGVRGSESE